MTQCIEKLTTKLIIDTLTYYVIGITSKYPLLLQAGADEYSKQSIALVSQALTKLEVGKLGVVSFGRSTTVLQALDETFSDATGAKIFANLKFDQDDTKISNLLKSAMLMFNEARGGTVAHSDTAQILIIISDGEITSESNEKVRAAVRAARNERIFIVFFVLDFSKGSFYGRRIYDDKTESLKFLAEEFPFPYYLVVRDMTTLPEVLAEALRRWFELVNADSS